MVKRLIDFKEAIPEAYFPKLSTAVAGRTWPSRPSGLKLQDVDRDDQDLSFDISDLEQFRNRILSDIDRRRITIYYGGSDDQEVDLNNDRGIDIVGNMIEASILSPNPDYYGNLHNNMHNAIAFIHDPENSYLV